MKKNLLFAFILVASGILLTTNAQQTIAFKIIETAKDGEVSISFNDGEFEGDTLDKETDDELDNNFCRLGLYINNLTDAPLRYNMGSRDYFKQQEFYSWWARVGIRLNLN